MHLIFIILFLLTSSLSAEESIFFEIGYSVAADLRNIELAGMSIPPNSSTSDLHVDGEVAFGARWDHYFSNLRWFGILASVECCFKDMPEQEATITLAEFGPVAEKRSQAISKKSSLDCISWDLSLLFRYPRTQWFPYFGVGLDINHVKRKVSGIDASAWSHTPGVTGRFGLCINFPNCIRFFMEWREGYTIFEFFPDGNLSGIKANYHPRGFFSGLGYAF